jgi:hypothetical protein
MGRWKDSEISPKIRIKTKFCGISAEISPTLSKISHGEIPYPPYLVGEQESVEGLGKTI